MYTLTHEELNRLPQQVIDNAQRGEATLVLRDDEPVFLPVPLGKGMASQAVRLELAARLYDCQQIGLDVAAHVAGLAYSEMVGELGRCSIDVIRLEPGELERDLSALGL